MKNLSLIVFISLFISILLLSNSCNQESPIELVEKTTTKKQDSENNLNVFICGEDFIDGRDDESYKTVLIGDNCWMSENMRFNTSNSISEGYDTFPSKYTNKSYGRLYNYYSAQHVCPEGWHLPSKFEFESLILSLNATNVGYKLKSISDWKINGNGSNESGFNALPTGIDVFKSTDYIGLHTSFWSTDSLSRTIATGATLSADDSDFVITSINSAILGFSCRCIKNE